ncbi:MULTISPECIES: YfjI family protein [Enterobacteriaceae]|nr:MULTISPECIES: YfjI family protein [Enterobacteriaceae]MCC1738383.1 DUF3987 domain-containing protein [Salmonella enterica subsp. enterica serovar Indiana]MCQ8110428.1 YfjI family protein [Salmonella enterica]HEB1234033.1 DUF3987 domain-containing protein [Escherichia albertii]EHB5919723.1 DUF3987 domain-containing protein [Escherichia coli]KAA1862258.1 DUF3987 domain-containing protein [Escherichia coli]
MCLLAPENPYPIYALPPLVRNAIIETQKNTQAPLAMVATSALTAISIACQNQIDMCRPGNLRGPVNLYSLILADSGERKTTVDKVFMKAFYLRDEALAEEYAKLVENYSTEKEIWEQKQKALESKFHKEIRAGKDYKATESELETHLNKSPVPPQIRRTIFNETTIEGMLKYYSDSNRSFALVSSEGGVIFDSRAMSKLGIINTLWDGGSLFIDRKSSPGINLKEPRLTMSAMIQPDVYHKGFCTRKKELVKTSGHHARFLMCQPTSTQGTRIITGDNYSSQYQDLFEQRINELIDESLAMSGERRCLHFSPQAARIWTDYYNDVESKLGGLGPLRHCREYAAKNAEYMARLAGLIHHSSGEEGDISPYTAEMARELAIWYGNEYVRLSNPLTFDNPALTVPVRLIPEELELFNWIKSYCIEKGISCMKKNDILQRGPNRFRKKDKINWLLDLLYEQNRVVPVIEGKTLCVAPNFDL